MFPWASVNRKPRTFRDVKAGAPPRRTRYMRVKRPANDNRPPGQTFASAALRTVVLIAVIAAAYLMG